MSNSFSQTKAFWAIAKASFIGIFKHPASVFFSLLFPIIFILIFGAFGSGGSNTTAVAITGNSDTTTALYQSIAASNFFRVKHYSDSLELRADIKSGALPAVIEILPEKNNRQVIKIHTSTAGVRYLGQINQTLENICLKNQLTQQQQAGFQLIPLISEGKLKRQIDFILPGQIGFSILFATLFGIAITFFSLREQLVLKRFFASPVNKVAILAGIGVSRLFFQLLNVLVIIGFGYFFLHFTLEQGLLTVIEIVIMSVFLLVLLMGVGLIIGSVSKTDAAIPLLINLFAFPQMLLSGTFFPVEVFPKWLQHICFYLPLTQYNNAIRKISFDGLPFYHCWLEISILIGWIVIIYLVLNRLMRWE